MSPTSPSPGPGHGSAIGVATRSIGWDLNLKGLGWGAKPVGNDLSRALASGWGAALACWA